MKKRTIALAFLAFVLLLVAGSLAVLRTRWAGNRICALATARVRAAAGLPLEIAACRIDPLRLRLEAEGIRVGSPEAPVFSADSLTAWLSPVQPLVGSRVHLDEVRLLRPRFVAKLPKAQGGGPCPPAVLAQLDVRRLHVEEGSVDVTLPNGMRIVAPRVEIRSLPSAARKRLRALVSGARRPRVAVEVGPLTVEAAGRTVTLERARVDGEIALDLSSMEIFSAEAIGEGVRLTARGQATDLCAPRVDVEATASGPIAALLALAGRPDPRWEGTARIELRARGAIQAPALSASVKLSGAGFGPFQPGDARAEVRLDRDRLVVEKIEVPVPGGVAAARGTIRLARGLPIEADVEAQGVDLADVLARLGVAGSWVSVRLDGKAHVGGTLSPLEIAGTLGMDVRDLRVLTHAWDRPVQGEVPVIEARRGRLDSAVRLERGGLSFEHARIAVGQGTVEADASIRFSSEGGFQVRTAGEIDLTALGHLATVPWAGRARLDATIGAAPYANPHVEGRARVEGFKFLQLDLGSAAAELAYAGGRDFQLHLRNVEGVRNSTRYSGEATVDLRRTPPAVVASRFTAHGRLRDLFDAAMEWIPRTRLARDAIDGDVEVSVQASGPATALDAEFEGRLGAGVLYGRPFDSGRADGRVRAGADVFFDRAELRRGTGVARARGSWGFLLPFPWALEVSFSGFPVAELALPGGPWSGTASGTAVLAGSTEHPQIRLAANGDAVSVGGVSLGSVQAGATLADRRLVVTGTAEGLMLTGEARLEGRMPFRSHTEISLEDAGRLIARGAPAGLKVRIDGAADAEGELADPGAARAKIEIARLTLTYSDFRVENAAPVEAVVERGRLEVRPFTVRGSNTELVLAGSRAPDGALDISASGEVDLRLLGGLVPALRKPFGHLSLEAHVSGTLDAPVLVGAGRLDDAGTQLGGATASLTALRGDLAFSQNRVLFDDLAGSLNGGRIALKGEVELDRFAPARLRVEGELDEVPLSFPTPSLPATFSGRVEAAGTPEAATLTGRLHVVRARYTENLDLEKSLFELRSRPPAPPRPYDQAGEWLRFDLQLVVDGDARVDNDVANGGVRGELLVTGTLASPGLVGSLSMTEGSRATYRGNEFDLKQALVTFTDRHAVQGVMDVHGEAQVRDYQIYMHLFGPLAKPGVIFTSNPALSQPDIITLLSLGFTTRDAVVGTGVGSVAAAAAAQALMSASGLDEQVRRFLPRGGPVKDVTARATSVYSEATGQVEPRAEFEGWLFTDKLRLRYQVPLSGARGQRAQAELRLGRHTAVQYQWDSDNPDVPTGDHGVDLKLRWEWSD